MFKKPKAVILAPESLRVLWMGVKQYSELEEYLIYIGFENHSFFPHMKFLLNDGSIRCMSVTGLQTHNAVGVHLVEVE